MFSEYDAVIPDLVFVRNERWAETGLTSWSYAHVLPYFRRQECWEGGASTYRGGDGPLTTRAARYEDPLVEAYRAAGETEAV